MRRERSSRILGLCGGHAAAAMTQQEQTRIVIAGRQAGARLAMREYLDAQPGLDVIGEAPDCRCLLEVAEFTGPDLVLLDWDLPGKPDADYVAALRGLDCQPLIVAVGKQPEWSGPAMNAGADAFVYLGHGPKQVVAAIRWVVLEAMYAQSPHRDDL